MRAKRLGRRVATAGLAAVVVAGLATPALAEGTGSVRGPGPVRQSVSTDRPPAGPTMTGSQVRVSSDGRFVAFSSRASLMSGAPSGGVYVRALDTDALELVSVGFDGGDGGRASSPDISGDGRYVVFESSSDSLVRGDFNGTGDVFVRDRFQATTSLVSVAPDGTGANGWSGDPEISGDGRHVVFASGASNLARGAVYGSSGVYVADLDPDGDGDLAEGRPRIKLVPGGAGDPSGGGGGEEGGGSGSANPAISADGRFVAFESWVDGIVAGDTNGQQDVFVADLDLDTVSLVSAGWQPGAGEPERAPADGGSANAHLSDDGSRVVFDSSATNLVADGDAVAPDTWIRDVFVRDLPGGATWRVSTSLGGGGAADDSYALALSDDGSRALLRSAAPDLVFGDWNWGDDVFAAGVDGGVVRVSASATGLDADDASEEGDLSGNALVVAFSSRASNLTGGSGDEGWVPDTNEAVDVFVREGVPGTGAVTVASRAAAGWAMELIPWLHADYLADGVVFGVSGDGRLVFFNSSASNLDAPDTEPAPNALDKFVHDRDTADDGVLDEPGATSTRYLPVTEGGDETGILSMGLDVSADGRYVVFTSPSPGIVPEDTDNKSDVFLRDTVGGTTRQVSSSYDGRQSGEPTAEARISANGAYVAFATEEHYVLGNQDYNYAPDVFRYDTATGTNILVSTFGVTGRFAPPAGVPDPYDGSGLDVSDDGTVVFGTGSPYVLPGSGDGSLSTQVARGDGGGPVTLVSATASGAPANGDSSAPLISADGSTIAYTSEADDLKRPRGEVGDATLRAVISASVTSGAAPLAVSFGSEGSGDPDDPGGVMTAFAWDFGDGATAEGQSASHTYAGAGLYVASLTVRDVGGAEATATTIVAVSGAAAGGANSPPVAVIVAAGTTGEVPLRVDFAAGGSGDPDGGPVSYAWDFGDGATAVGGTASHEYTASGAYTVRLLVLDDEGTVDGDTETVVVWPPGPASADDTNGRPDVYVNRSGAHVLATGGVNADRGSWGATSMTPDGDLVTFATDAENLAPNDTNGIADVYVGGTGADGNESALVHANSCGEAGDGLGARWEAQTGFLTEDGQEVAFASDAANLDDYRVHGGAVPANGGPRAVNVYVADLTVPQRPVAAFTGTAEYDHDELTWEPRANGTFQFSASRTCGRVSNLLWSFGDGTSLSGGAAEAEDVIHAFPGPGRYEMSLMVTFADGATDVMTAVVVVPGGEPGWSLLAGGVARVPERVTGNQGTPGYFDGGLTRLRQALFGAGWWSAGVRVTHEHAGTLGASRQGRLHAALSDGRGEAVYEFASATREWRVAQREFPTAEFEEDPDGAQGGRVTLAGDCEVAGVPAGAPLAVAPLLQRRRGTCVWTFEELAGQKRFALTVTNPADGSLLVDVPVSQVVATTEADLHVIRHDPAWRDLEDRVVDATWAGVAVPLRAGVQRAIGALDVQREKLTAERARRVGVNREWREGWLGRIEGWQAQFDDVSTLARDWLEPKIRNAVQSASEWINDDLIPSLQALPPHAGDVVQEAVATLTDWLPFGIGEWLADGAGTLVQVVVSLLTEHILVPFSQLLTNWGGSFQDYFAAMPPGLRLPEVVEYALQPLYGIRDPGTGELVAPGLDTIRDGWQAVEDTLVGLLSMLPDWVNVGGSKLCDEGPGPLVPCADQSMGLRDWLVWAVDKVGDGIQAGLTGFEIYLMESVMWKMGYTQRSFEAYQDYLWIEHNFELWKARLKKMPGMARVRNVIMPLALARLRGLAEAGSVDLMTGLQDALQKASAEADGEAALLTARLQWQVAAEAVKLEDGAATVGIRGARDDLMALVEDGEGEIGGLLSWAEAWARSLLAEPRLAVAAEAAAAFDVADGALVGIRDEVVVGTEALRDEVRALPGNPDLLAGIREAVTPVEEGLDATHDALDGLRDEVAGGREAFLAEMDRIRRELLVLRDASRGLVWLGWQLVIVLYDRAAKGVAHAAWLLEETARGVVAAFEDFRRDHLGGANWQQGGRNGLFGVIMDGLDDVILEVDERILGAGGSVADAVEVLRGELARVQEGVLGEGGPVERLREVEDRIFAGLHDRVSEVRERLDTFVEEVRAQADEYLAVARAEELDRAAALRDWGERAAEGLYDALLEQNPVIRALRDAVAAGEGFTSDLRGRVLDGVEEAVYGVFDWFFKCYPAVENPDGWEPAFCLLGPTVMDKIWQWQFDMANDFAELVYGPGLETLREKAVRIVGVVDDSILRPVQDEWIPRFRELFEQYYAGDLEDPAVDEISWDVKLVSQARTKVAEAVGQLRDLDASLGTPPEWFAALGPKVDGLLAGLAQGSRAPLDEVLPAAMEANLQRLLDDADAAGTTGAPLTGPALANAVRQYLRTASWSGAFVALDRVPLGGPEVPFLGEAPGGLVIGSARLAEGGGDVVADLTQDPDGETAGSVVLVRPVPDDPDPLAADVVVQHTWEETTVGAAEGTLEETDGAVVLEARGPCTLGARDLLAPFGRRIEGDFRCVWRFDDAGRVLGTDVLYYYDEENYDVWDERAVGYPAGRLTVSPGYPGVSATPDLALEVESLMADPGPEDGRPYGVLAGAVNVPGRGVLLADVRQNLDEPVEGTLAFAWLHGGSVFVVAAEGWRPTTTGFDRDYRAFAADTDCVLYEYHPLTKVLERREFGTLGCEWYYEGEARAVSLYLDNHSVPGWEDVEEADARSLWFSTDMPAGRAPADLLSLLVGNEAHFDTLTWQAVGSVTGTLRDPDTSAPQGWLDFRGAGFDGDGVEFRPWQGALTYTSRQVAPGSLDVVRLTEPGEVRVDVLSEGDVKETTWEGACRHTRLTLTIPPRESDLGPVPCTLTLFTEGGVTTVDFESVVDDGVVLGARDAVPGALNVLLRVPR